MNKSILKDTITIGSWISSCKNYIQLLNAKTFYEMVISNNFYPNVENDSIQDALDHLNEMSRLQEIIIQNTNENNDHKLQENLSDNSVR